MLFFVGPLKPLVLGQELHDASMSADELRLRNVSLLGDLV